MDEELDQDLTLGTVEKSIYSKDGLITNCGSTSRKSNENVSMLWITFS